MDASQARVDAAQMGILRYLRAHPGASDSADGIRRWWLADSGRELEELEIQAAIEQLVRSGHLKRLTLPDGSAVYAGIAAP